MVAPVKTGDILADKYCVEKVLGVGGMGVVVAAEHVALHQKVALKFMLADMLANENAVQRFMREARAAVRLRSEHVARVMDVGCLENGAPYIVMEFLEGEDLSDLIHREGAMPTPLAIDLILQACMAMAEAHSIGIVHRDLKPANLFITKRPDGTPLLKVLDFGISKVAGGPDDEHKTKSSVSMGSPGYMAPEQMRSAKHADHRADIWALGVILYLLLANRRPFEAESAPLLFAAVVNDQKMPLSSAVPDVDRDLEAIVHRCLEQNREARFGSVGELARALVPFGDERAAPMAASISNLSVATPLASLEIDASERSTAPLRKQPLPKGASSPDESPGAQLVDAAGASPSDGLPETHVANSMPATPNLDKKVLTTHRASAGQVAVAAPESESDAWEPPRRNLLPLVGGALGLAVLAVVATQLFSSDAKPAANSPAAQPVEEVPLPAAAPPFDAGAPDALPILPPDAAPPVEEAKTKNTKTNKRPEGPRPRPPKVTKPDQKPDPKPKPKPNDDPFGTMQ